MPDNNWEDTWANPATQGLLLPERARLTQEEISVAKNIWGHMRHLAGNREPGDPTHFTTRVNGDHPPDMREIDTAHTIQYFEVVHKGQYWEVAWGSREFSSSFCAVGRGRTLAEAMADCEAHQ